MIIGGPARCTWNPDRDNNRSTPIGDTVISRFAPCETAQAMDSSSSFRTTDDEN